VFADLLDRGTVSAQPERLGDDGCVLVGFDASVVTSAVSGRDAGERDGTAGDCSRLRLLGALRGGAAVILG
jgi:hypothetical protein